LKRQDYVLVLMDAVKKQGGVIRLGVTAKDIGASKPAVTLEGDEVVEAGVVIGADGMFVEKWKSVCGWTIALSQSGSCISLSHQG